MPQVLGPITLSSAGTGKTFNLGMAPTRLTLTVCSKNGIDNDNHRSEGKATATAQFCQSTVGSSSFNSNAHIVRHYEMVGGVPTLVLSASFNSFTASGIKLDVQVANTNYQVLVDAGN